MKSIFEETQEAVEEARKKLTTLMDIAEVPDGSPVEEKINLVFSSLEEALQKLPSEAKNAVALDDEGPVVYPVEGRDPRNWPTSAGKVAKYSILKRSDLTSRMSSKISSKNRLVMPKYANPKVRRAMTKVEYIAALEDSAEVEKQNPKEVIPRISMNSVISDLTEGIN